MAYIFTIIFMSKLVSNLLQIFFFVPETYLFYSLKLQIFGGPMLTLQHNKFLPNTFSRYHETAGRAGYVMLVWELYFIAKTTDNISKKQVIFLNYPKNIFIEMSLQKLPPLFECGKDSYSWLRCNKYLVSIIFNIQLQTLI